jgi:hypothetical protein
MDQEFQHTGKTVMRQATKQAEKQVKKTATKTEQKYAEIPSPAEILEVSWALYGLGYNLYDVADEYWYGEDRRKLAKLKILEAAVMNERLVRCQKTAPTLALILTIAGFIEHASSDTRGSRRRPDYKAYPGARDRPCSHHCRTQGRSARDIPEQRGARRLAR